MGTFTIEKNEPTHISAEHGNRVYWLGRYTERTFTTLKSLERLNDKVIDRDPEHYVKYLDCFGLPNTYDDYKGFIGSFVFDKSNSCSIAYSLERAYDNGIVLREEISTDAFAYLQLALDTLEHVSGENQGLVVSLLPLEDIIYGFYGCLLDHVYNQEIRNVFLSGRYLERLELYIRLKYRQYKISDEFERLCIFLERIPDGTPYRYNKKTLGELSELINSGCAGREQEAISLIAELFEKERSDK